ncbi:MAG: TlpA family protein disulfide reductase [Bacteroidetes bacterium]|nr:TlpA family protein disulfide reductase [Bacteroidota bacterium]
MKDKGMCLPLEYRRMVMIFCCLISIGFSYGQMKSTTSKSQFMVQVDENTVVKDSLGNRIAFPMVMKLLSGGAYTLDPVRDKNGKAYEYKLRAAKRTDAGNRETVIRNPGEENLPKPRLGDTLPAFELKDMNGHTVTKTDLIGKVVVINFWFSLCKPCLYEMPAINELAATYKGRSDILFLAPNWEKREPIEKFMTMQKMEYLVFPEAIPLIDALKIRAYPTSLVVGKDGKITASYAGGMVGIEGLLKTAIDSALAR